MNSRSLKWQRLKTKDIPSAEHLLRDIENYYVGACGRFINDDFSQNPIWALSEKKGAVSALIINSRSTLMPVLCGKKAIPAPNFLKYFSRLEKVHSIQGLLDEVIIMEKALEKNGKTTVDVIDYNLMSLDKLPSTKSSSKTPANLLLRVPRMTDVDALAPLQAGYEKEEVLPKGSVFNPAASRINIANIIARGQILAAELDGRIVGKINVSAASFTRYQIGGVYVHPDFRGLGIASRMTGEFAASLIKEGKGITLFVKKNNVPAKKLYAGLGFSVIGDYRISYY